MKRTIRNIFDKIAYPLIAGSLLCSSYAFAEFVYVPNNGDTPTGTVSVIDSASYQVVATVIVGNNPSAVTLSPTGAYAYVPNYGDSPTGTVSIINTTNYQVVALVTVGDGPNAVTLSPTGPYAYVPNNADGTVSIINTTNYQVVATVTVGDGPQAVGITQYGTIPQLEQHQFQRGQFMRSR